MSDTNTTETSGAGDTAGTKNTEPTGDVSLRSAMNSRWLRVLIGAIAAFVVVALVAPYFMDADRYRPELSALIGQQTGREITLGKIRANFLPSIGFSVAGFHMSNPPGFAPGEFIAAAEVRGNVRFWPLVLHRELRITSLELVHTKLFLLSDAQGRNNYTFSPAPAAPLHAAGEAGAPQLSEAGFAATAGDADGGLRIEPGTSFLQIDRVTLRDAEVVYGSVDAQGRVAAEVDVAGFDADLRHIALDPIRVRDWQADAKLSGVRLLLAGWSAPIAFRSGSATLRAGGLESAFYVDFAKAARVDGTFSVPDVEHAVVKFSAKSDDVDVDALMAGVAVKTSAASPSAAAPVSAGVAAGSPAANALGSELIAQGHVAVQRMHSGPHVSGPATADLRLYTDRLEIWPITIRFDGGSLQASARTDRRQIPERFAVNLEARNLNVGQMVVDSSALQKKFAGTGELDLQVFGSLDDTWKKSLLGTGEFAVRNGRIAGINLSGLAQSVAKFAGVGGDTMFTAITGDVAVGNERIDSRDIHLDSPRGTVDLRGSCGFDGTLAYDGQLAATLSQTAAPSGGGGNLIGNILGSVLGKNGKVAVGFALRGTLQHPSLQPGRGGIDFSTAGQAPAQNSSPDSEPSFPNLFHK